MVKFTLEWGGIVTFNEYMNSLNNLQNLLSRNFTSTTVIQDQVQQLMQPFADFQYQVSQNLSPILDMQIRIAEIYRPISSILEQYENNLAIFSSQVLESIANQHKVFIEATSLNLDKFANEISLDASHAISEISLNTISELDTYDYPSDFNDARISAVKFSTQESALSWEQIMTIVTFIITVIMFIQSQIPNKQLTNIENSLQEIIEIETKELNLLKKQLGE